MSLVLLDLILMRTKPGTGYPVKNASLTWTEEDTNFQILADCIREIAALSLDSGFEPYDNAATYSDVLPDYVSYNNNIYEYINPVPQSGITPGTDVLTWQIVSLGNFAHQQNTDQYLDFGGSFQVSAEDLYNLLTSPPGAALTQGSNTLTEDLTIFTDTFLIELKAGPDDSATPRGKLIIGTSLSGIAYQDQAVPANNSSLTCVDKKVVTIGIVELNEALELQTYPIYWKGNKDALADGDVREGFGFDPDTSEPAIILEKYNGSSWVFSSSRIL